MQYDRCTLDLEGWIQGGVTNLPNRRGSYQGYNHTAPIRIELRGLDNNDKRDRVFVFPGIAVHIELRHYSVEYSSAIEPDLALNSFHEATVVSTAFDRSSRSRCARLT